MSDPIVIAGAARTPMGGFQGELSGATASHLGAVAIRAALERAGVGADAVDEVLMGNVLSAGQGPGPGAPGRLWRRVAQGGALHDAEQDVRLGHEDDDDRL